MEDRLISRRDLAFVLYELLDVESLNERRRYADHSRETFEAALDTAHRIAAPRCDHLRSTTRPCDARLRRSAATPGALVALGRSTRSAA